MKPIFKALSLITLITSCQINHIPTEITHIPTKNTHIPSSYKMVWHDEFDGNKLNLSKWDYNLGPRKDGINTKKSVALTGKGLLKITTSKQGDKYHTGMINTLGKYEAKYGYFECRVKLQKQIGHWSAFWLQSPTVYETRGNTAEGGTEIDIFEYLAKDGDMVRQTLHWDGYGKDHKVLGNKTRFPDISTGWSTFGFLWTDKLYTFYINNKIVWATTEAISKRSEYIRLSMAIGKWGGDIAKANLPDSFYVDYVRVYQHK